MISHVTYGSMTPHEILWDVPLSLGRQLVGVWFRMCIDRSGEVGIDVRLRNPVHARKTFDPLGYGN